VGVPKVKWRRGHALMRRATGARLMRVTYLGRNLNLR
jgi:hypothetical protein